MKNFQRNQTDLSTKIIDEKRVYKVKHLQNEIKR